jgi:predicted dehydrogenase
MEYTVGVVGCGGMGKTHINWWNALENCRVTAICDISQEALDAAAEIAGDVGRYTSLDLMLDAAGIDILSIGTWPDMHAPLTIAAARKGVHVYCEKPMALDLEECDAMIEECDKAGVALIIGHNRRNDPCFDKAKKMLADGFIGDVRMIRGYNKGYLAGYGLMNMGSHLFDAMHILLGDTEAVWADIRVGGRRATAEDVEVEGHRGTGYTNGETAILHLEFACGIPGVAEFFPKFQYTRFGVEVFGTEGRLAIQGPDPQIYHYPAPVYSPAEWGEWTKIELTPEEDPYGYFEHSRATRMLLEMLEFIEGAPEPSSCGREAIKTIEIVMGAHHSNRTGCRTILPMADRRHPLKVWRQEAGLE